MHPHLEKTYNKLEHQREAMFTLIKGISEDTYATPPPGKWSVAQILTHLLTAERLSLAYMKKKSLGIETLTDSGFKHMLLLNLLRISQRLPLRYKAPDVIVAHTPKVHSREELMEQWVKLRSDLSVFLESIPEKHCRKLIFKHPFVGMLNSSQAMEFMYEHINHHLPQIKRLLN